MNVPLTISTYFDNSGSRQKLKMWTNGRREIVTAPIMPYCFSKKRPIFPCVMNSVKRKLLSKPYKEIDLYKCEFASSGDVGRYCTDDSIYLENHIPFVNRSMIDNPRWVRKFANTDDLRIICFDAEMRNDGKTFPIPSRNPIAGIGYKCCVGINNLCLGTGDGGINSPDIITMWSETNGDSNLITDFLKVIEEFDPDIIVGFNSNNFDMRYMRDRCTLNRINFDKYIARDPGVLDPVQFLEKHNVATRKKYTEVRIEGRISYDLFYPVLRDQSMFGIKSRQMKEVAAWYRIKDIVKEDMSNVNRYLESDIGRKTIDRYLRSDVNITERLFKIYVANTIMLSEKLFIPLDEMVNATPSLMSNLIFGRELMAKGIVSDGSVSARYERKHIKNKRGGWVETYKYGFIKKLKKLDFKSYYPFLTVQFNISPETCFIVGYEEYTHELGYKFWWKEEINEGLDGLDGLGSRDYSGETIKWFYASIPDSTYNKNVIVKIDMTHQGFLPRYMQELFAERSALKKRMKEIEKEIGRENSGEDVEYAGLKSSEIAIKIIINSFTGYVGSEHALYGNLANYVCITGFGRYITQRVIEKFMYTVVSSDTDAIYEDVSIGNISEQEANDFISSIVIKELGFGKCWIVMEEEGEDTFGSAYFLNTVGKNYYIKDESRNVVIKHGVATKSTGMARIVDRATDDIVDSMLKGGIAFNNKALINAIESIYDTSKWSLRDIAKGVHVRREGDYTKGTPIGLTIGRLAKERWKIPDSDLEGMQVQYIKIRGKSNYAVVSESDDINSIAWDKDYYLSMIDKLLENLGLNDFHPRNKNSVRTIQKGIEEAWG
jgi:DNA polymerase elongation subunit (family B)